MVRYIGNNSTNSYVGRNAVRRESVDIFQTNAQTLHNDVKIESDQNASCAGPLTIGDDVVLTIDGNLTVV